MTEEMERTPAVFSDYEMSENTTDLLGGLLQAQGELSLLPKDTANPFYRSRYTDLGTILEATRPALTKAGVVLLQPVTTGPLVLDKDGGESITVRCTTTLLHAATGQWIRSTLAVPCRPLPKRRDDESGASTGPGRLSPQAVGSAVSYSRRYSLMALLALGSDDDDGNAATGQQTRQTDTRTGEVKEGEDLCPVHGQPWKHVVGDYKEGHAKYPGSYDFYSCPERDCKKQPPKGYGTAQKAAAGDPKAQHLQAIADYFERHNLKTAKEVLGAMNTWLDLAGGEHATKATDVKGWDVLALDGFSSWLTSLDAETPGPWDLEPAPAERDEAGSHAEVSQS